MDFNTSRANHHNRNQFQTSAANKVKDRHCHCDLVLIQQSVNVNTADTNYRYNSLMTDAQSPHEFGTDYGNTTAGAATISVENLMKTKQWEVRKDGRVTKINGYMTSAKAKTTTIALCKWTPDPSASTAITPSVVHEFGVTETGTDYDLVAQFTETVIDSPSISAGDMLFLMLKGNATGNSFGHISIEYTDNKL